MKTKVVVVVVAIVALIACCGVITACTPLGNAVPGVSHSDCDAGDRLEGDSNCRPAHKSRKTPKPRKTSKKTPKRKTAVAEAGR